MTKRSIPGYKNEDGQYVPIPLPISAVGRVGRTVEESPNPDVSLDEIGKRIIIAMDRATRQLLTSISSGDVSREVIGALKDCQSMYKDLRKDEKEILEGMSDEDIEKALSK